MSGDLFERLAAPIVADDVSLVPLARAHTAALAVAFAEPELWTWMLVRQPANAADVDAWIDEALERAERREQAPFVVVLPGGALAGTTRFLDLRWHDGGLEIGWTMVFANARGAWVNSRVKALMFERAFDVGFSRVQLKTDARNVRSRAAIAAVGAEYEGTLRAYQRRADGTLRDTALFAVLALDRSRIASDLAARAAVRRTDG